MTQSSLGTFQPLSPQSFSLTDAELRQKTIDDFKNREGIYATVESSSGSGEDSDTLSIVTVIEKSKIVGCDNNNNPESTEAQVADTISEVIVIDDDSDLGSGETLDPPPEFADHDPMYPACAIPLPVDEDDW